MINEMDLRGKKTVLDFTDQCCYFNILLTIDINVPSTVGFYYYTDNLMTALPVELVLCLTSLCIKLTMELMYFLH